MNRNQLAARIEHTNLKPAATAEDIKRLCEQAKEYGFAVVCVAPFRVQEAAEYLKDSSVRLTTVVGFPYGFSLTKIKVEEALAAVRAGATDIDMLMNLGAFADKNYSLVEQDIRQVAEAIKQISQQRVLKVIIEPGLWTEAEKVRAAQIVKRSGADYVKTSTGLVKGSKAEVSDVRLLRRVVGQNFGVKASGGIRTFDQAVALVKAGADRLGTSHALEILHGKQATGNY